MLLLPDNEEIRRRERVIRIFPNPESAIRLIGALLPPQRALLFGGPGLAEVHEDWQERKYLDMEAFYEWAEGQKKSPQDNGPVVLRV